MKRLVLWIIPVLIWGTGCADDKEIAHGISGSLTWTLSSDGTLLISGKGEICDYQVAPTENLPTWFGYRNDILKVIIGDEVSRIGNFAIYRCENLTSVSIGNSVSSIGIRAFSGCSSLVSVNIPASLTIIEDETFSGCKSLSPVNIPNLVTAIGNAGFYKCESLTSIIIPNSVLTIGKNAFFGCNGLTHITIGNSVTTIGDDAFRECSGLKEIINYHITPQEINKAMFNGLTTNKCTLFVPSGSENFYRAADGWKNFTNIKAIQ